MFMCPGPSGNPNGQRCPRLQEEKTFFDGAHNYCRGVKDLWVEGLSSTNEEFLDWLIWRLELK